MICKVGHPLIHKIIGYRPANNVSNQNEFEKIDRQDFDKHGCAGTHDAMNSDLFRSSFCRKGSQPKEPESTKHNGEHRKYREDLQKSIFCLIVIRHCFIHKLKFKWSISGNLRPNVL